MGDADTLTWNIAEVQAITGLSRRDIQRCCYSGKGGLGLLSLEDSSWWKHSYDVRDVAVLFLVAQRRRRGVLLSDAVEELRGELKRHPLRKALQRETERLADGLDALVDQIIAADALEAALGEGAEGAERLAETQRKLRALAEALEAPTEKAKAPPFSVESLWSQFASGLEQPNSAPSSRDERKGGHSPIPSDK